MGTAPLKTVRPFIIRPMKTIFLYFRRYPVLFISGICALASILVVPPDAQYLSYIDPQVICLLFCLMAVTAGFQALGLFSRMAGWLLTKIHSLRGLYLVLIYLPFLSAMLVTNDVTLLTFVPFALYMLRLADAELYKIRILVLQTIAANIGSMLTPIGNPQNLFLYTAYQLDFGFFVSVTMLPVLATGLLLFLGVFLLPVREIRIRRMESVSLPKGRTALYAILFLACLLSVFHLLPYWALTGLVLLALLASDRTLLLKVDYALLATFLCFFIFSGNLSRLPGLKDVLKPLLASHPVLAPVLASQIISNVPAAILLSPFTNQARGLLLGVNLGGLGTLIASLASVISFQFYSREPDQRTGAYLGWFSVLNFSLLLILLALTAILPF